MAIVLECEIPLVSVNEKYIVARGRMILSQKYRDCKNEIALRCKKMKFLEKPMVDIDITTYKDIDACIKVILDGLNGKVYYDDRDIAILRVYKTPAKRGSMDKIKVDVY